MTPHLSAGDVSALLHGRLSADRAAHAVAHLQSCSACAAAARSHPDAVRSAADLTALLSEDPHRDVDTALTGYVDGTLPRDERMHVESHLAACARCRQDVSDLREMAAAIGRPRRNHVWLWSAAAAAALALIILGFATFTRRTVMPVNATAPAVVTQTIIPPQPAAAPPLPRPAAYARKEWTDAVHDALQRGALATPAALAELQLPADALRGPGGEEAARLEPSAAVVDETRPQFRWPASEEAEYVVSVFAGDELAAESDVLSTNRWRPRRPLARGRRYHWQVEIRRASEKTILPAPPAPPALFRILDLETHESLRAAREQHGGDPLLLGILYARAGLRDAALRELAKVQSPEGQRLRRSIAEWP